MSDNDMDAYYKDIMYLLEFPKTASMTRVFTAKDEAAVRALPAWDLSRYLGQDTATTTVVAASDLAFDTSAFDAFVNATLVKRVKTALAPEGPFHASLAHIAFDAVGDMSTFGVAHRPLGTFGTLYVALPRHARGGEVTFRRGHDWNKCLLSRRSGAPQHSYAACYRHTHVTAAAITEGDRVLLVYNLIYNDPAAHTRDYPASIDEAAAHLRRLGTMDHDRLNVQRGCPVLQQGTSFETLSGVAKDVLTAFLQSGVYDVALATLVPDNDVVVDALRSSLLGIGSLANILFKCVELHPATGAPSVLQDGLHGSLLPEYTSSISDEVVHEFGPTHALIFWPKRHRLEAAGLHGAMLCLERAVTAAANDGTNTNLELLGCDDILSLAIHVMVFMEMDYSIFSEDQYQRVQAIIDPSATSFVHRFAAVLTTLGSINLILEFVATSLNMTHCNTSLPDVAMWLYGLCQTHGWELLFKSLAQLVDRWSKKQATMAPALHLIASLAGVDGATPVCPALHQPFTIELIKGLYRTSRHALDAHYHNARLAVQHEVLGLCLVLDAYVAENGVSSHWLHRQLPPLALATIDANLDPAKSMARRLLDAEETEGVALLTTAAPALVYGLRLQRRLRVPALAAAIAAKLHNPSTTVDMLVRDEWSHSDAVVIVRSLLTIALCDGTLTSALLERCRTVFGSCTVPAIRDVLAHDITVDNATRALLFQSVLRPITNTDTNYDRHLNDYYRDHPHPYVAPSHDDAREVDAGWRLAVDTLELIAEMDASQMLSYVRLWNDQVLSQEPWMYGGFVANCLLRHTFWTHEAWLFLANLCIKNLTPLFAGRRLRDLRPKVEVRVDCDCELATQLNTFMSSQHALVDVLRAPAPMCTAIQAFLDGPPKTTLELTRHNNDDDASEPVTITIERPHDDFSDDEVDAYSSKTMVERLQAMKKSKTIRKRQAPRITRSGKRTCVPRTAPYLT
ncbi:hypothetical protein SPRG_19259 [Saprolegnia parasitica CBS 223.65]|uniref:Uncharacterized protein n=1 Tax=Saprolegnia parasitica (strain CBS 223.65) TaxID=695850 RepID=A0A067CWL7_SAPPC|nr:hypothetical protein SPRG_19259 [Saprolegnia parasitica CBS 223.65]KDO33640.1 hypothetical protein SPRG_19259 [Saprolegnia parasitica CBS 223.65]|eukprot:XP_012195677.1 hypothetical protein SPRG_19259 [Saprolegnia parasitica CBS 223.65]